MFAPVLARRSVLSATGLAPMLRASGSSLMLAQRRLVSTQHVKPTEEIHILNEQRLKRPTSPHLTIYQPQLTWYMSGLTRITGVPLSFALYGASLLYLLHPYFPAIDSAHLIQFAHDLPTWLKGSVKMIFAAPFTYHAFNGIRHLLWDAGYGLTLKGVYATGYTVLAATAVSSIYLAFFV
ncbi:cytochrome b subunit of succinate dehydrogenase, Sdh3p [Saitozyma podzolica]|uniref:Cytochrome b subunit of succinate dehydrogenase, Sdh3p n=1 Tax=Saitozyma podzolica TaxID=1890683 RepID=A0A427Y858_9TREE|nr:cytochrome b subunit of succinate dehydrogenase, Sdh3p [Saitozyma podzolica]